MIKQGILDANGEVSFPTKAIVFVDDGSGGGEPGTFQGLTDAELRASSVPVSGPLTDAELRASSVPVSGPLTDTELRATAVSVTGPLTDTELRATAVSVTGPLTNIDLTAVTGTAGATAWDGVATDATVVAILKAIHAQNETMIGLLNDIKTNTTA